MASTIRIDLLKLLGRPFILDHLQQEIRKHQEAQMFRDYVADCIGAFVGREPRYSDLAELHFPIFVNKDTRTAEEITADNAKALAELCGGGEEP